MANAGGHFTNTGQLGGLQHHVLSTIPLLLSLFKAVYQIMEGLIQLL